MQLGVGHRKLVETTSSRKAWVAKLNWGVRVQALHCTNWLASLRLPRPHENFLRGYLDSTTSFWSTLFGKLLKQMECIHLLCISVSKPLSFSLLRYLYATQLWLSVIHISLIKLKLCRGWKWYVRSWEREMISCLICRYSAYSFAGTCLEESKG